MTPKETVLKLYAAYRSGDADEIAAVLHEDAVWVAPPRKCDVFGDAEPTVILT